MIKKINSPALLLAIVISAFFTADGLVMLLLKDLPRLPMPILSFIDSILVIALLFPVLYFFVFRQSKLQIAKLTKTNEEMQTQIAERKKAEETLRESENLLRSLSSQLLTAQEAERRRISGELHDELGQSLAVIKLQLSHIERKLENHQKMLREECKSTLEYTDQVIDNVRRLSRDLSPSILEDLGFPAALRWMVNEFTKHHPLQVSLILPEMDHFLSQTVEINLYRIFQETLTNIAKHAQATRVSISVHRENGTYSFRVEDDGRGFDLGYLESRNITKKGLGILTMKERVLMLGGTLKIYSQKGKGTRITFQIPVEKGDTP